MPAPTPPPPPRRRAPRASVWLFEIPPNPTPDLSPRDGGAIWVPNHRDPAMGRWVLNNTADPLGGYDPAMPAQTAADFEEYLRDKGAGAPGFAPPPPPRRADSVVRTIEPWDPGAGPAYEGFSPESMRAFREGLW